MLEYCRSLLSPGEAQAYDQIVRDLTAKKATIACSGVTCQEMNNAAVAVYDDHAELFYMGHAWTVNEGRWLMNVESTLHLNFPYDAATIRRREDQIARVKQDIEYMARRAPTDRDKVLMVAEYIVRNTVYAIDPRTNQDASAPLCVGIAQCSGYSRAVKLLLDHLGIECVYVTGEGNGGSGYGPHAWNIVKVGSRYYHLDVTFMDGSNPDESGSLQQVYLFYDDAKIAIDHRWDRKKYPACVDASIASRSVVADPLWIPSDVAFKKQHIPPVTKPTPTPVHKRTPAKPTPTPVYKNPPAKPTSPTSAVPSYDSNFHLEKGLREAIRRRERVAVFKLDMRLPPHRDPDDVVDVACRNSLRKEACPRGNPPPQAASPPSTPADWAGRASASRTRPFWYYPPNAADAR